jgi:RimJ/RimL family protein N-acetyltransferase
MADSAPETDRGEIQLRAVTEADLPTLFEQQLDPVANQMAAFTARNPADREAFLAHWARILSDDTITKKTILFEGQIAGYLVIFHQEGIPEVGYWIGRDYWGRGIATRALAKFLTQVDVRPLYAHVAKDNIASLRVLEKCGFEITGEGIWFSNARGGEVEEFILKLS